MDYIFKNCKVYRNGNFVSEDIGVCGGVFAPVVSVDGATVIDCKNKYILPGFADVHVHLREPGFVYKETVESGSLAAAAGGYTTVCSMPNLIPAPDSPATLAPQLDAIKNTACINVLPYGTITKGQQGEELADMEGLAPLVAAFSDDGKGVQSEEMMLAAMQKAKELDKIIAAHCEDNSLLNGGYIHDGEYAKAHGHRGICSESEWGPIKRDLELAAKTGCKYHVCHISTKESVELIRQAKKNGVDVTCETGPHYLILDDSDLKEEGRFKMNPPLRSKADREALIEGIIDGTIDMIATDHAPHSAEEKGKGLEKSLMGVVGIETAFPLMYTHFVKTGIITLEKLVELMSINPSKRFGFDNSIESGNFTVFDLDSKYEIDPEKFLSKGRATPFEGYEVFGECLMTVCGGKTAWQKEEK
ncbi:MAG: dihydroorotase [Clostridia bacterium]|nr:dihydroorotase [Clostridia bacterium]